jgi:hypothetical protein
LLGPCPDEYRGSDYRTILFFIRVLLFIKDFSSISANWRIPHHFVLYKSFALYKGFFRPFPPTGGYRSFLVNSAGFGMLRPFRRKMNIRHLNGRQK